MKAKKARATPELKLSIVGDNFLGSVVLLWLLLCPAKIPCNFIIAAEQIRQIEINRNRARAAQRAPRVRSSGFLRMRLVASRLRP